MLTDLAARIGRERADVELAATLAKLGLEG